MRADRLVSLLLLLQTRGQMTAGELASRLEVSERTIHRDMGALSAAGVPVYTQRGPRGGCALLDGYRTDLTGLSSAEAAVLFLLGLPLGELGLGPAALTTETKLLAALPPSVRGAAERARARVLLDPPAWWRAVEPVPHLPSLLEAVWNDQRVVARYRRGDYRGVRRVLDPLGLVVKAGIWYLVAAISGRVVSYRVSRFESVSVTEDPARRPEGFDLGRYWSDSLADFESTHPRVEVRVRVAADLLLELPGIFGESLRSQIQSASRDPGGGAEITLSFESLLSARYRLLGLGTGALVLDPSELRDEIVRSAEEIAACYRGEPVAPRPPFESPAVRDSRLARARVMP